jgi:hypothetical protein
VTRGARILIGLALLAGLLALSAWTTANDPSPPQIGCPPHEAANPWCER